MSLLFTQHDV